MSWLSGVTKAIEKAAKENAMSDRATAYNQAIETLKASTPKYDELAALWLKITSDRYHEYVKQKYANIGLSEDQTRKIVSIEIDSYKKSLSEQQFKTQLDELHQQSIDAAVKQLEFERDNPDRAGEQTTEGDPNKEQKTNFETEFFRWLGGRIESNFEGSKNESGEGAKILRAGLGISVSDLKRYGILGGDNSYLRKIIPTWSDSGGLFGGGDSFFRKPFG